MDYIDGLLPPRPPLPLHGEPSRWLCPAELLLSFAGGVGPGSGTSLSGFESRLCQVLPGYLTTSLLTSSCLCVPSCKVGIRQKLPHRVVVMMKWNDAH